MKNYLTKTRFFSIFLLLVLILNSFPVYSKIFFLEADYYQTTKQDQKIVVGRGEILSSESNISRIAITDPSIADLQLLNEKEVFVRGRFLGMTTLLVWEKESNAPSRFELTVIPDIEELRNQLLMLDPGIMVEYIAPSYSAGSATITENIDTPLNTTANAAVSPDNAASPEANNNAGNFPDLNVDVETGDMIGSGRIVLTGIVKNSDAIAKAVQIAGGYVGDSGIMIVTQPGGQLVDEDIQASGGGGSAFGGISATSIGFTTNKTANINRGVIITSDNGSVISFLKVENQPQIAVSVRFYEISRTLSRNLGLNASLPGRSLTALTNIAGPSVSNLQYSQAALLGASDFTGDVVTPTSGTSFLRAAGVLQSLGSSATAAIFNPKNGIGVVLQALQDRGEVKTLSEPTLIITNGEPAQFLAGGEVPVQSSVITNGGAAQTITYEPFGINLTILPTITEDGRIHLQIVPELREIDTELSDFVSPAGGTAIRPPAFKTRRSETQVELEPGEAFAISGLLSESNTRGLRKTPGVGDVPILGSLFRSKSFSRGETELLVIVAPEIVRPTRIGDEAKLSLERGEPDSEFNYSVPLTKPFYKINEEVGPNPNEVPIMPTRYFTDEEQKSLNRLRNDELSNPEEYQDLLRLNTQPRKNNDDLLKTQVDVKEGNKKIAEIEFAINNKQKELIQSEQIVRQKTDDIVEITKSLDDFEAKAKKTPQLVNKEELLKTFGLLDKKKAEIAQVGRLIKVNGEELAHLQEQLIIANRELERNGNILAELRVDSPNSDLDVNASQPAGDKVSVLEKRIAELEQQISSNSNTTGNQKSGKQELTNNSPKLIDDDLISEKSKTIDTLDRIIADKTDQVKKIRTSFVKHVAPDADMRTLALADINEDRIGSLENKFLESSIKNINLEEVDDSLARIELKKKEELEKEKQRNAIIEAKKMEIEKQKTALIEKRKEEVEQKRLAEESVKAEAEQKRLAILEQKRQEIEFKKQTELQKKAQIEEARLAAIQNRKDLEEKNRLAAEAKRVEKEQEKRMLAEAQQHEQERLRQAKLKEEDQARLAKEFQKQKLALKKEEEFKQKQLLLEARRIEAEQLKHKAEEERKIAILKRAEEKENLEKQKQFLAEARKIENEKKEAIKLNTKQLEKQALAAKKLEEKQREQVLLQARKIEIERKQAEELKEKEQAKQMALAKKEEEKRRKEMLLEAKRIEKEKIKEVESKTRERERLVKESNSVDDKKAEENNQETDKISRQKDSDLKAESDYGKEFDVASKIQNVVNKASS